MMRTTGELTNLLMAYLLVTLYASGNFVINNTDMSSDGAYGYASGSIRYYNSTTLYLTSNLTVNSGEKYVYDNCTLIFNCSRDGDVVLRVRGGGELIIRNGTRLTINHTGNYSNNYGYNYQVIMENNSKLRIETSNITYAGYGDKEKSGIVIYTNNVSIKDTYFYRCYGGIYIRASNNITIKNCTFNKVRNPIFNEAFYYNYESSRYMFINNSCFENIEGSGVITNEDVGYVILDGNIFRNCTQGVKLFGQNLLLRRNRFLDIGAEAISVSGENITEGFD